MPNQEDIASQQERLSIHRATLAHYLKQKAEQGSSPYVLPNVVHGILAARKNIRQIKGILHDWGISVENHPDDTDNEQSAHTSNIPRKVGAFTHQKRGNLPNLRGFLVITIIFSLFIVFCVIGPAISRNRSQVISATKLTNFNGSTSEIVSLKVTQTARLFDGDLFISCVHDGHYDVDTVIGSPGYKSEGIYFNLTGYSYIYESNHKYDIRLTKKDGDFIEFTVTRSKE